MLVRPGPVKFHFRKDRAGNIKRAFAGIIHDPDYYVRKFDFEAAVFRAMLVRRVPFAQGLQGFGNFAMNQGQNFAVVARRFVLAVLFCDFVGSECYCVE